MYVTWALKLKSDTLQAPSNSELSLTLLCIAEVMDETKLHPVGIIRRESNVDVLSLFHCLVLTWGKNSLNICIRMWQLTDKVMHAHI